MNGPVLLLITLALAASGVSAVGPAATTADEASPAQQSPTAQIAEHGCQTRACWRRVREARARRWCDRTPRCYWRKRYEALPAGWRAWAYNTEGCESGHSATAHGAGGTYHGSMQFDLRTWGEAGGSGDPHNFTIWEQRWRAVKLAQRVGTGRWPVCGR